MTWIGRTLLWSPYHIALCVDEAAFHRKLRYLRLARGSWPPFVLDGGDATTHYFQNEDQGLVAVVCIRFDRKITSNEVRALLVHEGMHVWRAVRNNIGENEPSREMEAYAMQHISRALMDAYDRTMKRNKR